MDTREEIDNTLIPSGKTARRITRRITWSLLIICVLLGCFVDIPQVGLYYFLLTLVIYSSILTLVAIHSYEKNYHIKDAIIAVGGIILATILFLVIILPNFIG